MLSTWAVIRPDDDIALPVVALRNGDFDFHMTGDILARFENDANGTVRTD